MPESADHLLLDNVEVGAARGARKPHAEIGSAEWGKREGMDRVDAAASVPWKVLMSELVAQLVPGDIVRLAAGDLCPRTV
jgi:hypothetical protein